MPFTPQTPYFVAFCSFLWHTVSTMWSCLVFRKNDLYLVIAQKLRRISCEISCEIRNERPIARTGKAHVSYLKRETRFCARVILWYMSVKHITGKLQHKQFFQWHTAISMRFPSWEISLLKQPATCHEYWNTQSTHSSLRSHTYCFTCTKC